MKNQKNKKSVRKPVDVYKQCPSCKSKNIIPVAVDVICGECDWMSCEEHVQGGGMDDLAAAFCEHFAVAPEAMTLPFGGSAIQWNQPLQILQLLTQPTKNADGRSTREYRPRFKTQGLMQRYERSEFFVSKTT